MLSSIKGSELADRTWAKESDELGSNPSHIIYYFHDIEFFLRKLLFLKFENKYAYPGESL